MPLWEHIQTRDFELQSEDDVVREIRGMLELLEVTSQLKSDHILNLLMEVEGQLPEDKEECIAVIDRYLQLPDEERLNFQLGRRMGYYERLEDLSDSSRHQRIAEAAERIRERGDDVDEVIRRLKDRFI